MSEATTKVRLTSYLSPELLAAIQRDATRKGQTLSVWMQRAAEAALRDQEGE